MAAVRLRGLPWTASTEEIVSFFEGLTVNANAVIMVTGYDGKPKGEAFIWFSTREEVEAAKGFDRRPMGNRYVEIFETTPEDYERAMKANAPRGLGDGVIRVRGMPFAATVSELAAVFHEFGISESQCLLGITSYGPKFGTPNGEGFVQFRDETTAKIALEKKQAATLGNRYLELFPSSRAEMDAVRNASTGEHVETVPGDVVGGFGSGILKLRGLPFSATVQDVVEFCTGFGTTEEQVLIKFNLEGRPAGDAYVRMKDELTAEAARNALDRKTMKERYIEAFISSEAEAGQRKGGKKGGGKSWGKTGWSTGLGGGRYEPYGGGKNGGWSAGGGWGKGYGAPAPYPPAGYGGAGYGGAGYGTGTATASNYNAHAMMQQQQQAAAAYYAAVPGYDASAMAAYQAAAVQAAQAAQVAQTAYAHPGTTPPGTGPFA